MSRARMIKPGFFANDELAELPMATRMLFAGLWTIADREGRLEDRPKRIKGELFRYDDLDIDSMLNALQDKGFVVRYEADGQQCIEIVNFLKHQRPHNNEVPSVLPPREKALSTLVESRITKDGSASALNVDISLEPLTQNLDHNPPTVDTRANGKSTDVSPKIPKKPLPMNGTAQQIVAAFCLCAGIQEPAVYAKAVGQAQQLAKAGVTAADIPDLFAAANWSDSGVDLGKMLNEVDRWRSAKHSPAKMRELKYPPPIQKRVDNWTNEQISLGQPILPFPDPLQAAIDDWRASLRLGVA